MKVDCKSARSMRYRLAGLLLSTRSTGKMKSYNFCDYVRDSCNLVEAVSLTCNSTIASADTESVVTSTANCLVVPASFKECASTNAPIFEL